MNKILILTTGGTIDKIYFDAKSTYEVGPPNIRIVLSEMKLAIDYRIESLMRKDSLDITDDDRELIKRAVETAAESKILITHGTDTMIDTARALQSVRDKTIVLTGALEPALFKTSDALFNIGCGLAAVQTAVPGIYIAMNGCIFNAMRVKKNRELNQFESLA